MAADLAIVRTQGRYALITALRTPRTLIFSIIFPLILLVMFNSIFSKGANETHHFAGHTITAASYFTAGLAAYSITLTTFTALVVAITTQRESGQLKRLRGTPMPAWTFMVAQIARSLVLATAMTVALFALGVIAFHVHLRAASVVGIAVYLVLGVATMTALGIALTAFTPTPDAASTIGPFAVVMLSFVSGVFIGVDTLPNWLETIGKVFPLYHLASGMQTCLVNGGTGTGVNGSDVLGLVIWGAIGVRIAMRHFRWEPLSHS